MTARGWWVSCTVGWLAVLAATMTGCRVSPVTDLEARQLRRVQIVGLSPDRLELSAEIEIYNPYRVSARIRDLECRLALTGDFLAAGRMVGESWFPRRARQTVQLALSVPFERVTEADFAALFETAIPYHFSGTATLIEPVPRDQIRLELRGNLPAPEDVQAHLTGRGTALLLSRPIVRAGVRDLLAGRGVVEVVVKNPLSFAVPIESFEYQIEMADHTLGRGAIARDSTLAPGPNRLQLPVQGNPLGTLGGFASGLLNAGQFDVAVSGTVVIRRGSRRFAIHLDYDVVE